MNDKKIILLAHSTGTNLYNQGRISEWFNSYNRDNDSNYSIELQIFPKARFYGWKNYPYDYWNIWVNHKGYKFEPSIKKLSKKYDVIIWKHCFPGSAIDEDKENPIVDDEDKSLAAYKLQYNALKEAMHEFPNTKFLVWTLAVTREGGITAEQALNTKRFVEWVKNDWDESGDNVYIWDFYGLETTSEDGKETSLYLRPEFSSDDNHPNEYFNKLAAPKLCRRIVDIIEK